MNKILYEDKDVTITDREIIIKYYYFPFGNKKKIPFSKIKGVEMKRFAFRG